MEMKKIVIIGGGFAGLRILYKLNKSLHGKISIDLIDKNDYSLEKPSLPEVAFAGKEVEKVRIPISSLTPSFLCNRSYIFLHSNYLWMPTLRLLCLKAKDLYTYYTYCVIWLNFPTG